MSALFRLLITLLVTVFSLATARAQFTFATNAGALTVTGYIGSDSEVTVPSTVNGMPVKQIGTHAFYNLPGLISIQMPASVTNYQANAFVNCTNLLAIYFQGIAPVSMAPVAAGVFSGTPRATLYYLAGAAGWTKKIDGLPIVQWDPQVLNQLICTTNNGLITVIAYAGPGGSVVLPATFHGWPVTSVGSGAFLNSVNLTGLTIAATVTNVGNVAFAGCTALTSIVIPNNIAGSGVFSNCTALTNVTLPTNITRIAEAQFSHCSSLTRLIIPGSITNLGDRAFAQCQNLTALFFLSNAPAAAPGLFTGTDNVTNYYFPRSAGWGPTYAGRPTVPVLFNYTNISGAITINSYIGITGEVTIPETMDGLPVRTIANVAFRGPIPTDITIGSNVTSIAGQAFIGCSSLQSISVHPLNSIYSSVDGALLNKAQTTLLCCPAGRAGNFTIPAGVTRIGSYAFQTCAALSSVTVPATVTTIAPLGFNVNPSLVSLYFLGSPPVTESFAFYDVFGLTAYYLPWATNWGDTFSGYPTALWLPQAQPVGPGFLAQSNQFGFNVAWANGATVIVEATPDLSVPLWLPVQTNTMGNGPWLFTDPAWTNHPARYYRLRSP